MHLNFKEKQKLNDAKTWKHNYMMINFSLWPFASELDYGTHWDT